MLKINDSVKTAFLTDSTPKELEVEFNDTTFTYKNRYKYEVNWWPKISDGPINPGDTKTIMANTINGGSATSNWFSDMVADVSNIFDFKYIVISFMLDIDLYNDSDPYPSTVDLELHIFDESDGYIILTQTQTLYVADHIQDSETERVMFYVPTSALLGKNFAAGFSIILPSNEIALNGRVYYNKPLIHVGDDPSLFPYPYKPYNESDIDTHSDVIISNNHLLTESFSLNESLCSEHNIKFGLCESAYCQFTVTDDNNDYKNREIKPYIKLSDEANEKTALQSVNFYKASNPVPGSGSISWTWTNNRLDFSTPLPWQQYTLVMNNNYFENFNFVRVAVKVKLTVVNPSEPVGSVLFYPQVWVNKSDGTRRDEGRIWYDNMELSKTENCVVDIEALQNWCNVIFYVPIEYGRYYNRFNPKYYELGVTTFSNFQDTGFAIRFLNRDGDIFRNPTTADSFSLDIKEWQINLVTSKTDDVPSYNPEDCIEYNGTTIDEYIASFDSKIPLGVFTVNNVKKDHVNDILKQQITAYDKLTALEQNAADWYTQYMFGISLDEYQSNRSFQFARQIFSTYFNYAKSVGLEKRDYYTETVIQDHTYNNIVSESEPMLSWPEQQIPGTQYGTAGGAVYYISYKVENVDPSKLYVVDVDYVSRTKNDIPLGYRLKHDELGRGFVTGSILVDINGSLTYGLCVDSGDYFMVPSDCTSFTVYIATSYRVDDLTPFTRNLCSHIKISEVESAPDLTNGETRLVYYRYNNPEIFACDSSITGRDVVRSLLEVCGCFFRLNRYTGKPEFVYCTKAGLYPRDDLYPADDLYPREGTDYTITMGKYQSFIQEDYTVQKYGKIQIRKNVTSNETKSIVEWEYTGDDSYDNVYAIDDNIFYCNDKMEYDYDNMPEVHNMLVNMWGRISNMDYVPTSLVCKGMPWIECGDRIGVLTKTGGAETFIFHRTLTGIQSLKDNYESEGDEYTEAINDYGYKEWEDN